MTSSRIFRISKCTSVAAALVLVAGCSAHPDPIIDTRGVNMTVYEQDLSDCKSYAEQVPVASGVAKSAAAGAAVGGAIGAVVERRDAAEGAAVGAITAGAASGSKEIKNKEQIVKRCLRYRGYRVLN